jgi:hypothetical protein
MFRDVRRLYLLFVCAVLGLAALGGLTTAIYHAFTGGVNVRPVSQFDAHLSAYLAAPEKPLQAGRKAPLKGKVVPINLDSKRVDSLYGQLPDELRAAGPEEVGAVLWLTYGTDKATGRQTCRVQVIDLANREMIAESTIYGERPRHPSDPAPYPHREIVGWLYGLRERS